MSDTVLLRPLELCDTDLDAVSAGATRPASPGAVLKEDLLRLEKILVADLRKLLGDEPPKAD
ncbi:MAG TPA: hypothetical protein VMA37_16490 [Acetobacteraceae bacterium]|nr:hypothetical protein [Acetobacteraceae bacterium]